MASESLIFRNADILTADMKGLNVAQIAFRVKQIIGKPAGTRTNSKLGLIMSLAVYYAEQGINLKDRKTS